MITFATSNLRAKIRFIPIHYLNMSAFLSKHGIENNIAEIKTNKKLEGVQANLPEWDKQLISKIKKSGSEYVGLSFYTVEYNYTLSLIRKIKEEIPNIKIIVGGNHVTLRPQDLFISGAEVDAAVLGEGEFTLLDIVKGKRFEDIPGIAYLKNNEYKINESRPLSKDLAHLPIPAYDKLDMDYYLSLSSLMRHIWTSGLHIFTSLGCPFSCTFCANPSIYKAQNAQKIVRYKTVEQVVEELVYLKDKYDMESFYFQDDTFTIKKERVHAICDEIIDRKLNLLWGTETRVNLVDDDMLAKMKKAGCCHIDLGVESGSQEALKRMKKGTKIEDVYRTFNMMKRHGLRTGANMMVNTPGETEEDLNKTIECMKKLKATIYGTSITVPFIGTQAYDDYVKPELTIDEYMLYENPYLYSTIIDSRFKLSQHDLPISKKLMRLKIRYDYPRIILDLPLKAYYIKYLLRSKYKFQIFNRVISNFFYHLKNGVRFLMTTMGSKLKKNTNSLPEPDAMTD